MNVRPCRLTVFVPFKGRDLLLLPLPCIAFLIAAGPLQEWLVDDAGISFAYARNLAEGWGLVSQPGKPPVEGFSNPLWTLLFVPWYLTNSGLPLWFSKFLAYVFSFASLTVIFYTTLKVSGDRLLGVLTAMTMALSAPFVVWNVSGLENPLYALIISVLLYVSLAGIEKPSPQLAAAAGTLTAAAALTRPEAILFLFLWPTACFATSIGRRNGHRERSPVWFAFAAAFALPYVAYKCFTAAYFGDLLPNTFYAKADFDIVTPFRFLGLATRAIEKATDLLAAPFGLAMFALAAMAFVFCSLLIGRARRCLLVLVTALGISLAAFLFLPRDWMPLYRFATPFFVIFYPTLFISIWASLDSIPNARTMHRRFCSYLFIMALSLLSILVSHRSLSAFYREPTIPLSFVAERYGKMFNAAARILQLNHASLLLPDIGGTLLYSRLEVFDLAGLTDKTIAHALRNDDKRLQEYILDEMKPTFIHMHGYWSFAANLDHAPEFREQYVALREAIDIKASAIAKRPVYRGDYVRRESLRDHPNALSKLRSLLYERF